MLQKTDEQLPDQLALTQAIMNSVAEGIYATDREGRLTFVNPVAQEMLGWREADLLGREARATIHYRDSCPHVPGTASMASPAAGDGGTGCSLRTVLKLGCELRNHEEVFVRKDGSTFPALCSSAPILSDGGAVTGAVVAFSDITERKRAQSELRTGYERERRIAETLQRSLLMCPPADAFPHLVVETLYEPASDEAKLGGDFYDAFALPEGRVALVVGDICGQGLAAAVWSAEVKYALRAFLYADGAPERALAQLNDFLTYTRSSRDTQKTPEFVALSVVVETSTGRTRLAVAGIEPPLVLRADGNTEIATTNGLPLGLYPEKQYEAETLFLHAGDTLIQLTDGITEARAPKTPEMSQGPSLLRYEGFVHLALAAQGTGSLRALGQAILEGARTFSRGTLRDDACLLLARWQ